jgi:hypothetical protein
LGAAADALLVLLLAPLLEAAAGSAAGAAACVLLLLLVVLLPDLAANFSPRELSLAAAAAGVGCTGVAVTSTGAAGGVKFGAKGFAAPYGPNGAAPAAAPNGAAPAAAPKGLHNKKTSQDHCVSISTMTQ